MSIEDYERITEEFISRKKKRNVTTATLVLLLVFSLPCMMYFLDSEISALSGKVAAMLVLVVSFVGIFTFEAINWRCPACGNYLGSMSNPTFCPHCKTKLKY